MPRLYRLSYAESAVLSPTVQSIFQFTWKPADLYDDTKGRHFFGSFCSDALFNFFYGCSLLSLFNGFRVKRRSQAYKSLIASVLLFLRVLITKHAGINPTSRTSALGYRRYHSDSCLACEESFQSWPTKVPRALSRFVDGLVAILGCFGKKTGHDAYRAT